MTAVTADEPRMFATSTATNAAGQPPGSIGDDPPSTTWKHQQRHGGLEREQGQVERDLPR